MVVYQLYTALKNKKILYQKYLIYIKKILNKFASHETEKYLIINYINPVIYLHNDK